MAGCTVHRVPGLKPRASCMLGKRSTNLATSPARPLSSPVSHCSCAHSPFTLRGTAGSMEKKRLCPFCRGQTGSWRQFLAVGSERTRTHSLALVSNSLLGSSGKSAVDAGQTWGDSVRRICRGKSFRTPQTLYPLLVFQETFSANLPKLLANFLSFRPSKREN